MHKWTNLLTLNFSKFVKMNILSWSSLTLKMVHLVRVSSLFPSNFMKYHYKFCYYNVTAWYGEPVQWGFISNLILNVNLGLSFAKKVINICPIQHLTLACHSDRWTLWIVVVKRLWNISKFIEVFKILNIQRLEWEISNTFSRTDISQESTIWHKIQFARSIPCIPVVFSKVCLDK